MVRNFTFDVPVRLEVETLEKIQDALFGRATPDKNIVPRKPLIYIKANRRENEWGETGITTVEVTLRTMRIRSPTVFKILDDLRIPCNEDSYFALSDASTANQAARKALALRPGSIIAIGTPPNDTMVEAMALANMHEQNAEYWEAKANKFQGRVDAAMQSVAAKDAEIARLKSQPTLHHGTTNEIAELKAKLAAAIAQIEAKETHTKNAGLQTELEDEDTELGKRAREAEEECRKVRAREAKLEAKVQKTKASKHELKAQLNAQLQHALEKEKHALEKEKLALEHEKLALEREDANVKRERDLAKQANARALSEKAAKDLAVKRKNSTTQTLRKVNNFLTRLHEAMQNGVENEVLEEIPALIRYIARVDTVQLTVDGMILPGDNEE